jgi:uncharacterized protein (UPF0332 family)
LNELERCFESGMLRHVTRSKIKSDRSISEAREWLEESKKNLDAGSYRSTISSSYLAVFHAARSILFWDGIREKSHYCIGVYLGKYVEEGILEEDWTILFESFRNMRHNQQYGLNPYPPEEEICQILVSAEDFVARMEGFLAYRSSG